MPTRRGWLWAGASIVLALVGRLLGLVELYVLSTAAGALVVAAVAWVRLGRYQLVGTRSLHPPRVHTGQPCRAELRVRNQADRRSPLVLVRDPFDGGRRSARFLLAPLDPGEAARAAYRLPSDRRGVFAVGPMQLELQDPFGLAASSSGAAGKASLVVYPRVDPIAHPPQSRGDHIRAAGDSRSFLGHRGEDFYTLRPYDAGDDLRRVHWPSSARTGDLLIRQDEAPWQGGVTVAVDLRKMVHSPTSLEVGLSVAASVVAAAAAQRTPVRLVTSAGVDSGARSGPVHLDSMLTRLAEATLTEAPVTEASLTEASLSRRSELDATAAMLGRPRTGGSLVVVTTVAASPADLHQMVQLRSRYGLVILVLVETKVPPGARRPGPLPALPREVVTVRVGEEAPFPLAWNLAVGRAQRSPLPGGTGEPAGAGSPGQPLSPGEPLSPGQPLSPGEPLSPGRHRR